MQQIYWLLSVCLVVWGSAGLAAVWGQDVSEDPIEKILETVPESYRPWFEEPRVKFKFYDPQKSPQPFPGMTHFDLRYQFEFKFRSKIKRRSSGDVVQIRLRISQVQFTCNSVVALPNEYNQPENFWGKPLVIHELEHVQINVSPKIQSLGEALVADIQTIEIPLTPELNLDNSAVRDLVNQEIKLRSEELQKVIQYHHDQLDSLSNHGRTGRVEDSFFGQLFSRANLENAEFKYLDRIAKHLSAMEKAAEQD